MKYGAIPENLPERLALATGKVPIPLVDALFSILKSRVLMAAARAGIFEEMAAGPRTASAIAAARGLDPEVTEIVLRSMVWAGYLRERSGKFRLAPVARRSLVAGAPMDLRGFLAWNYVQWEMAGHMEELLATGRGVDFHATMTDPGRWRDYQRAMLEVARFDAPILAARVPVRRGATRLLDLAGAHGLLGAAICRRHPPMRSTVIDLPAAIPFARDLAREAGHADLVEHREGDLLTSELGGGYDVVLLANILHHFRPEQIHHLLPRVAGALAAEGTVAIWELERPDTKRPASEGDGAALFFRLTSTAGCYRGEEFAAELRSAGLERVRIVRPLMSPGSVLVLGRKS